MKLKRIFSKIGTLAVVMSVMFLMTNCELLTSLTKITITYYSEKGTAPVTKTVNVAYKLTEEDLAPISAAGFIFDGWYIGTAKAVVGYAVTKNITLSAKWSAVSGEKATITYSTEKGTAPAPKTVDLGYKLTVGDLAPISAEGFIFDGWYVGTEKAVVGYAVTKNITLTAKWSDSPKVTITYSTEKGTAPAPKTVDLGYKLTADDLAPIYAEGFIFDGWYIGTEKAVVGYEVTKNMTLTAKWSNSPKVTFTYSTENGTAPAKKTVYAGYKLTEDDLAPIFDDAFVFDGWYIDEIKAIVGYVVTKNITLTAKWVEQQYISFTTSKNIGETIELGINAEEADQPYIWLDLNNNGIKDEGEAVKHFTDSIADEKNYTVTDNTFRLYGNVTFLSSYSNQLTSLDVSGCTSLKELRCSANSLINLDVSKNTSLKELYCAGNRLTNLNVSGCTALKELYCVENQLTSLDLSGCTALESLSCGKNQLTSINVSGCIALKSLDCSENRLTDLDLRGCESLEGLWCSQNQFTNLDMSVFTNLRYLECSNNKITNLDLSGCMDLRTLRFQNNLITSLDVSGFTQLGELKCKDNPLTSLDVSGCTNLAELSCIDCQLTNLNVSDCTWLKKLYCYNNLLTSLDVSDCLGLIELECQKNRLTSLDVSGLSDMTILRCDDNRLMSLNVTDCLLLEILFCFNNLITSLDLSGLVSLKEIWCYENRLVSLNASGCVVLKTLWCRDNQLTSIDVSGCTELVELSCPNNRLTNLNLNGLIALSFLYCQNNQLTSLDLRGNPAMYALSCYGNNIQGANIDALIDSLCAIEIGTIYLIDIDNAEEGNTYTSQNIIDANAKNWYVYAVHGAIGYHYELRP